MDELRVRYEHRGNKADWVISSEDTPAGALMFVHSQCKNIGKVSEAETWTAEGVEVTQDACRRSRRQRRDGCIVVQPYELCVEKRGVGCPQRMTLQVIRDGARMVVKI